MFRHLQILLFQGLIGQLQVLFITVFHFESSTPKELLFNLFVAEVSHLKISKQFVILDHYWYLKGFCYIASLKVSAI